MGRTRRSMVAVATALVVVIVGSGVASAKQVPATKWVTAACAAQTTFFAALNSAAPNGFSAVQSELSSGTGDLATAKSSAVGFFDAASSALKTLVSSLNKLGIPKITNGDKIEKALVQTAKSLLKVVDAAKTKAGTLSTSDSAAYKATGAKILADFSKAQGVNRQSSKTIKKLDKDHKVASKLDACSGGGAGSAGGGNGGGNGSGNGGGNGGGTPPTAAPPGGAPPAGTGGGAPRY